jgi:tRNA pseudouridine synthase 10
MQKKDRGLLMVEIIDSAILEMAKGILEEGPICDFCMGRQFAWLGTGTTNQERGQAIFTVLQMTADYMMKKGAEDEGKNLIRILAENGQFKPAQIEATRLSQSFNSDIRCKLCTIENSSVFEKISEVSQKIFTIIEDLEFNTFLIGSIPDPLLVDREDEIRGRHGVTFGESLKSHFNRELGKSVGDYLQREVNFDKPDVVFIYDMKTDRIRLQINPVFIYGRYKKLVRGIPQSRWDCSACDGKGCPECNGTGRRYPDSISEYIGIPAQQMMNGRRFKFHAAGREDVDVLMLGDGRPFVLEISEPRIRTPDLDELSQIINEGAMGKIEVRELSITNRELAQKIKSEASENVKEYLAQIDVEQELSEGELKVAEKALSGTEIEQRTPNRVAHRRSDLIRKKQVIEVKLERKDAKIIEGLFKVQGGTYIKELISGDDGRTQPSLSSVLGLQCTCIELNVIAIHGRSPHHNA